MGKRVFLIAARLFFGLLTLTAIGIQLSIHIQLTFNVVNFFSYFTNLSNILASIVFISGAILLLQQRQSSIAFDIIRGTSVVCMSIVGIVYGILLRNEDLGALLPWINVVLHYIMPILVVLDWFYQPPGIRFTIRQVALWLVFPLLYLVYTLIRGSIVAWYPYPFLNPAKTGGYGGVALYCVAILLVFLLFSWLLMLVANNIKWKPAQITLESK